MSRTVPESVDLKWQSRMNAEQIAEVRERIVREAQKKVDPNHLGFRPVMQGTDDGDFFPTDDASFFRDWWEWVEQVVLSISEGFTRVALGLTAGMFAIAASHMYASEGGARVANWTLGAAGVFGLWFLTSSVLAVARRR
jgi:hypothetical protein